jgi:hypothetical protein
MFDHPFIAGQKYIDHAIEELEANPPKYIVDSAIYERQTRLNFYPLDLMNWVRGRYDFVDKIEYGNVWILRDADAR